MQTIKICTMTVVNHLLAVLCGRGSRLTDLSLAKGSCAWKSKARFFPPFQMRNWVNLISALRSKIESTHMRDEFSRYLNRQLYFDPKGNNLVIGSQRISNSHQAGRVCPPGWPGARPQLEASPLHLTAWTRWGRWIFSSPVGKCFSLCFWGFQWELLICPPVHLLRQKGQFFITLLKKGWFPFDEFNSHNFSPPASHPAGKRIREVDLAVSPDVLQTSAHQSKEIRRLWQKKSWYSRELIFPALWNSVCFPFCQLRWSVPSLPHKHSLKRVTVNSWIARNAQNAPKVTFWAKQSKNFCQIAHHQVQLAYSQNFAVRLCPKLVRKCLFTSEMCWETTIQKSIMLETKNQLKSCHKSYLGNFFLGGGG